MDGDPVTRLMSWRPARAVLFQLAGWTAAGVVVIICVALAARVPDDGRPHHRPNGRAQVGTLYALTTSSNPRAAAGSVLVRVPGGAARVTVYTRTDEAFRTGSEDTTTVRAPSAGQLFTVATAGQAPDPSTVLAAGQDGPDADLDLVLDGRRYPLDTGTGDAASRLRGFPGSRSVAVGVHGDPKDVALAVTFDGVTQTFDLTRHTRHLGRAAPLYAPTPARPRSCGPVDDSAGYPVAAGATTPRCTVQLRVLPWVPSVGWAPAGQAWPLVSVQVVPPTLVRTAQGDAFTPETYDSRLVVQIAGHGTIEVASQGIGRRAASDIRDFVGAVPVVPTASRTVTIRGQWRLEAVSDSAGRPGSGTYENLRWMTTLT